MPRLTMMSGPAASGKSTMSMEMLKADQKAVRLNRDLIRKMSLSAWKPKLEEWVVKAEMAMASAAVQLKKNIIVDDTNLTDAHHKMWSDFAKTNLYTFEVKKVFADVKTCIARDWDRGEASVGPAVIERQFLKGKLWNKPAGQKVCIFDIDGTIADLSHRVGWIKKGGPCLNCTKALPILGMDNLGAYAYPTAICPFCHGTKILSAPRWDMFHKFVGYDEPIDIVVRFLQSCIYDFFILLVSGRSPENNCDKNTVDWLTYNKIPYNHLIMRRAFHHGPDDEEKQLILNDILQIIPKEDIAFVVDDRPRVIKMWKQNGLRVIPVRGSDNEEFYKEVA